MASVFQISMNVTCSTTYVSMAAVKMCLECSDVSVTKVISLITQEETVQVCLHQFSFTLITLNLIAFDTFRCFHVIKI